MESSVEPQEGRGAALETRRGDGGLPGAGASGRGVFRAPGLPGAGASGRGGFRAGAALAQAQ